MSKPYYKYKTLRGLERAIYEEHCKFIAKKWGKEALNKCNMGWSVSGTEDQLSVETKVCFRKPQIVVTNASLYDTRKSFIFEVFEVEDY